MESEPQEKSENQEQKKAPYDVRTRDGWEDAISEMKRLSRKASKDSESLTFASLLFCTRDPLTGKPYDIPHGHMFITVFDGGSDEMMENQKDEFAGMLKAVAVSGGAIAQIITHEAWSSSPDANLKIQPRHDPGRSEDVFLLAVHREFESSMWTASILKDEGHRSVDVWKCRIEIESEVEKPMEERRIQNRFDALPAARHLEEPVLVFAARALVRIYKGDGRFVGPDVVKEMAEASGDATLMSELQNLLQCVKDGRPVEDDQDDAKDDGDRDSDS